MDIAVDVCGGCGESSVEQVYHDGQEQNVCVNCGALQAGNTFFSEDKQEGGSAYVDRGSTLFANQSAPLYIQTEAKERKSEGLKQGLYTVRVLASYFHLTNDMKQEVYGLFKRALANRNILMWWLEKKKLLAGSCVYVVMRQHNLPVTVCHICSVLGCCREDFSKQHFRLLATLGLSISTPPIEDQLEGYVDKCKGLESSETSLLKSRALQVLQIAKDCWLTSGRMTRPFLLSSLYLSWQSINIKRNKVSLNSFCNKMGFVIQQHAGVRKNELVETLCTLANKIPWLENLVTPNTLCKYLEELLKYSESLLYDLGPENLCFRKFQKKKKKTVHQETVEEEISDEEREIDSYIRSEEEVLFLKGMKQKLQHNEDTTDTEET